jgi:FkbM family methyltransferase
MKTIAVDGHTFCIDIIVNGSGWVIDAGARGFALERKLIDYVVGQPVYAIDIENFHENEIFGDTVFRHAALTATNGETEAYLFGNGTANFIKGINEKPGDLPDRPLKIETVQCITLEDIYAEIGTNIDLLKLDIEGAEYEVLLGMKDPIPKQISCEFHRHCHLAMHNKYFDDVMRHMHKNYHITFNQVEPGEYFLDVLFIRKDLL